MRTVRYPTTRIYHVVLGGRFIPKMAMRKIHPYVGIVHARGSLLITAPYHQPQPVYLYRHHGLQENVLTKFKN